MSAVDLHIGKQLRKQRTILGLTQEVVAKALGITFQQVQKYEKGANALNASRLFEMAEFMQVPLTYFFEGLTHSASSGAVDDTDHPADPSDRELLELQKGFRRIKNPVIRKRLADLVRAIGERDSQPIIESARTKKALK